MVAAPAPDLAVVVGAPQSDALAPTWQQLAAAVAPVGTDTTAAQAWEAALVAARQVSHRRRTKASRTRAEEEARKQVAALVAGATEQAAGMQALRDLALRTKEAPGRGLRPMAPAATEVVARQWTCTAKVAAEAAAAATTAAAEEEAPRPAALAAVAAAVARATPED